MAIDKIMECLGKLGKYELKQDCSVEDLIVYEPIKQAILELKAIKETELSEALKCLEKNEGLFDEIAKENPTTYKDGTVIEAFLFKANTIEVERALLKAQEDEKLKVDICEMFGLDNLFPYNDRKAILKELEEYMDRKNQLWVDFMKLSKESKEQKKVLEIIKEKPSIVMAVKRYSTYDNFKANNMNSNITEEEFELLKRYAYER